MACARPFVPSEWRAGFQEIDRVGAGNPVAQSLTDSDSLTTTRRDYTFLAAIPGTRNQIWLDCNAITA